MTCTDARPRTSHRPRQFGRLTTSARGRTCWTVPLPLERTLRRGSRIGQASALLLRDVRRCRFCRVAAQRLCARRGLCWTLVKSLVLYSFLRCRFRRIRSMRESSASVQRTSCEPPIKFQPCLQIFKSCISMKWCIRRTLRDALQ